MFPLFFVYSMNEMLFALHIEGVRFQYQSYSGRQEVLMVLAQIPPRVKGHDSGGCIWCTLIITDVILYFITCEMGNTKEHEIYILCACRDLIVLIHEAVLFNFVYLFLWIFVIIIYMYILRLVHEILSCAKKETGRNVKKLINVYVSTMYT